MPLRENCQAVSCANDSGRAGESGGVLSRPESISLGAMAYSVGGQLKSCPFFIQLGIAGIEVQTEKKSCQDAQKGRPARPQ
jgi:hypothetical protein